MIMQLPIGYQLVQMISAPASGRFSLPTFEGFSRQHLKDFPCQHLKDFLANF